MARHRADARGPARPPRVREHLARASRHDPAYDQVKVYTITDRPVYRPGQPVKFKFWVGARPLRPARRLRLRRPEFHGRDPEPQGREVLTKNFEADDFGGFDGSFELPSDAALGGLPGLHPDARRRLVPGRGVQEARVRGERRRPDEAGDAGREGHGDDQGEVLLRLAGRRGEGQVQDHAHDGRRPLVSRRRAGTGSSGRATGGSPPIHAWYPGWSRWGVLRPRRSWWGRPQAPPEVVAEAEVPIRPDGTVAVEIDTALAKEAAPRPGPSLRDHGRGHRPVAPDHRRHGHRAGRPQAVHRLHLGRSRPLPRRRHDRGGHPRPDARPQAGRRQGDAQAAARSRTTPTASRSRRPWRAGTWRSTPTARRTRRSRPSAPGQYRLSADDRRRPGARDRGRLPVRRSRARASTAPRFRFNDLEIIPDKKEYQPGDTLRLLINTNQVDSTVLLFVRPTNGVYLPPKVVHLRGQEHGRGDRHRRHATCRTSSSRP